MAIRFPEVYPEEKEIISPDDWNRNLAEFVDEINGRLDSDNLRDRDSIDSLMIKNRAIQRLFTSRETGGSATNVLLNNGFVGWQTVGKGGNEMPYVEFEANTDGWLICEANATWAWNGNGLHKDDVLDSNGDESFEEEINEFVGRASELLHKASANRDRPPGGWMGTSHGVSASSVDPISTTYDRGYSQPVQDHTAAPVSTSIGGSGAFTMQHGNFPQGWWEDKAVDYYAIKIRIVVDGEPVSETGWIHVGNYKSGSFICGVAPISAGFHRIELQARAALLADLAPHRKGLDAKFRSVPTRGKFTSKFATTTSSAPTPMPVIDGKYGIECRIKDRNLLVSYRKH